MATISPLPVLRATDSNNDPISGAKLYTYEAGTTTPKTTYVDRDETTAHTNPIVFNAAGYSSSNGTNIAPVWLGDGAYTYVLKDASDVEIWTIPNIAGSASAAFGASVVETASNLNITSVYKQGLIIGTANLTLTLLSASAAGEGFYISLKANGGDVVIDPDGSETVDGASTITVTDGQSAIIITDGVEWYTLFQTISFKATTSSGIIIQNDAGNTVATFGASSSLNTAFAGAVSSIGSFDIAGQASGPATISLAEDTDNGTNKVTVTAPASLAADATVTLPSETCTLAIVTPWVAYTPTFTGFGTVTDIEFFSRRNGSSLEVMGKFTPGTKTATEARISFGFNGTDSNVTSNSTVVPSIRVCGNVVQNGNNAAIVYCLIEGGVSYITFGAQSSTSASLTKQTGTGTGVGTITIGAVQFSIPITGW